MHANLKIKKQSVTVIDQRSKSFVKAFVGLMARQWAQSSVVIAATNGDNETQSMIGFTFNCTSAGGYGRQMGLNQESSNYWEDVDQLGVVIGSGTTTVAPDDYALGTQIRSGEKTGTILYCGTGVHGLTTEDTGDTGSFKILGIFKNVSGASINVKEVGVYATGKIAAIVHPNAFNYCILHDNITTIALADGEFLEVEYTISIAT